MFFVYILQSLKTDRFYVGHTEHIQQRLIEHNSGTSKYARTGIPWKVVHTEEFQTRAEAMKREMEIKNRKSRSYILKLLNSKTQVV